MLIVCPSCSTSYMIDPASLGPAGRTVRCARCRDTWFAHPPEADEPVDAFVTGLIAEAEHAERRPDPMVMPREPGPGFGRDGLDQRAAQISAEAPAPVQIAESPPIAPPLTDFHEPPPAASAVDHMPIPEPGVRSETEDFESFAARRHRLHDKRQRARRSSRWMAIVLVLFAFNIALVGARHEVVRYLPQTASLFAAIGLPVNLRQLSFEDVRVSRDTQGGSPMLSIEGKIVSKASRTVEVPRLRFSARTAQGREIYTWTVRPERSSLQPGESFAFRSFAKPPPEAIDILVRFVNVQDASGAM